MDELSFRYAYTPRYSPWYNGCEEVWSMSKQYIRKKRLSAIMNDKEVVINDLIMKSFDKIDIQSIAKCISRSLSLLNLNI